jgi:hypothetical protein
LFLELVLGRLHLAGFPAQVPGCLPRARWTVDEVLLGHAHRGLFVTRPESGKGIVYFIDPPEDMLEFETIELLLKLS